MGFSTIDYVIVIVYLGAITIFGALTGGKQRSARDYFLGKTTVPWYAVTFAVVSAETSTLTFISIPGLAYATDFGFLQITFGYLLGRITVALLLLPSYFRGELSTAYAFLEGRFGSKTRSFASIVFLLTRIFADGVRLFATAIPIKLILGVSYPTAILIIAVVALLYTYLGGVRGVIWVDAVQMFVYLGGALLAIGVLLSRIPGGWTAAIQFADFHQKLKMIHWGFDKGLEGFLQTPYTFIGGLIGGALLSMASHGTDQLIVQRLLATKSLPSAQKAIIGSGVVIIFQFAIFLFVGILLFAYYHGASVVQLGLSKADEIFPHFIIEGLPPGVSGIIIAGLLAAAMSTLAGSMSAMASSTVLDLYKPYFSKGDSSSNEKKDIYSLRLARMVTVLWAGLLIGAAIIFMKSPQAVVELALSIASFTYGGLLGTFLLGVLFRQPKQEDALAGFVAGIAIMITVIALKLVAWTWFTFVGVIVTLFIGSFLSKLGRREAQ